MAIYDQPVRVLLRQMIAELAPGKGKVFTREQATSWFADHYPKIQKATVAAHLLRFSTNARSRIHYNPRPDEDLLFQIDSGHFRLYDPATDPAPIHSSSDVATQPSQADEELGLAPSASEFAYESDLRDFLAKDLSIIEPGLRLYEDEGITGVEFPVGGRFVDILGVDAQNQLVVIELKVSRAYDRVVGQLLRYVGWIEQNLAGARRQGRHHRQGDLRGSSIGVLDDSCRCADGVRALGACPQGGGLIEGERGVTSLSHPSLTLSVDTDARGAR